MAVSVILKDGPIEKQSIGDLYDEIEIFRKPRQTFTAEHQLPGKQGGNPYRKTTTKYF